MLKYYESKGSNWDKAKIGEEVKSVAGIWKTHQKINEDDIHINGKVKPIAIRG